jgi:hypothetical protein
MLLGYKTNLADDLLRVASGFRAPNLAELTSNGVHEGTNRYEVKQRFRNRAKRTNRFKFRIQSGSC